MEYMKYPLMSPSQQRYYTACIMRQIDSVLKIPSKQQVFSCVHTSGGVTIFSLYDCHVLDIRQINDWTKQTNTAWLDSL